MTLSPSPQGAASGKAHSLPCWGQMHSESARANSERVRRLGVWGSNPPCKAVAQPLPGFASQAVKHSRLVLAVQVLEPTDAGRPRERAAPPAAGAGGAYSLINRNKLKKPLFHAGSSPIHPPKT